VANSNCPCACHEGVAESGEIASHIPSLGSRQRRVGGRGWVGCRATVNILGEEKCSSPSGN